MRQAPPIALTLSNGGPWRAAQVALPILAASVLMAWAAAPAWLTLAAVVLVGGVAWRTTSASGPVHLQWTGEQWSADAEAGEVDLMLDLGAWLLLRFRSPTGRPLWLSAPRAETGSAERGLRAALYARGAPAVQRRS